MVLVKEIEMIESEGMRARKMPVEYDEPETDVF